MAAVETSVSFFMSSPIKSSLSPESLKGVLPKDANVVFWTAESKFLSPQSAKDVCSQHTDRQVMAFVPQKRPLADQAHSSSLDKEASKVENLLEAVLQNQANLQRQIARMEEEHEENQANLQRQITRMEEEHEFYAPLNLTRPLAVVSLMATLLKLLNIFFMRKVNQNAHVKAMGLVFPKESDISYFKAWWFLYHETLEVPGLSLQDFWSQDSQLGYKGRKQFSDSKKWQKIGTDKARLCAGMLHQVMEEAEQDCINFLGPTMTVDMLRKAIGFYISLLRFDRNAGMHLLENLFVIATTKGEKQVRPSVKDPFQFVNKEWSITKDEEVCRKASMVLTEIISNLEELGHLSCISPVVKWFGESLLALICSIEDDSKQEVLVKEVVMEEAPSWQWCPELELWHQDGVYLDKEGCFWVCYNDEWLLWREENDGLCSWDGNGWRKRY